MNSLKRTAPAVALAALLSLGLAACGESSPEQQSSVPSSELPNDAAATMDSTTQDSGSENQ